MDIIITILPVVTKDLPISPRFTPYDFLSRCKFSNLTFRQPKVKFYLLTFPRFPLRKKEQKSCFEKNRTHDFRTSRCAGYLLDHPQATYVYMHPCTTYINIIWQQYSTSASFSTSFKSSRGNHALKRRGPRAAIHRHQSSRRWYGEIHGRRWCSGPGFDRNLWRG